MILRRRSKQGESDEDPTTWIELSLARIRCDQGRAAASFNIWPTCAPTVNLSCASLNPASPLFVFQSSFRDRVIASLSVSPSVLIPAGTVDRSVVSGGSATNSPTSPDTKSLGPPEFAPITGVLHAIHSTKTSPKGSLKDGKQPS